MVNLFRNLLLATALMVCPVAPSVAQSATGLRVGIDLYHPILKSGLNDMPLFAFGVDHDLNDRLSIALEYRLGSNKNEYISTGSLAHPVALQDVRISGWTYRAAYCLRSNDDQSSVYFGPTVGIVRLSSSISYQGVRHKGGSTVFPLGLRAGIRGGLRGFYMDLFCSAQYLAGGGSSLYDLPFSGDHSYITTRSMQFTAGFAMGGGWGY